MTQVANPPADAAPDAAKRPRHRGRRLATTILVVISCILAPISAVAIWTRNQLLNTDRYVENVAPLATNEHIINTAATQITTALFTNVDVAATIKSALPSRAGFLASPVAAALRELTQRTALAALESKQFETIWKEANRVAHDQLKKALTGTGKVVNTSNGKVTVDLSPIVDQVRLALDQRGVGVFDRIPIDRLHLKFELVDAHQLAKAQRATRALNTASWLLPVLMFLCLGGALACSLDRRRTLAHWGLGVAFAVAILGLGITIGRTLYLNAVTTDALPRPTAAAVFDTLMRFLRNGIRLVGVLALIVAIVAWVVGPSPSAVRVRATARSITGGSAHALGSHGLTFGRFGTWARHHTGALRLVGVGVVLLIFVLIDRPTAIVAISLAVLLVLYLALVEIVARAGTNSSDAAPPADTLGASHP